MNIFQRLQFFKTINGKKYKLKQKVFFKEPLKHPASGDLIYSGKIISFVGGVELYLSDAMNFDDISGCSSWIKTFSLKDFTNLIKV